VRDDKERPIRSTGIDVDQERQIPKRQILKSDGSYRRGRGVGGNWNRCLSDINVGELAALYDKNAATKNQAKDAATKD